MGFIINRNGDKIQVNNPEGYDWEKVVILQDDTILVDRWIASLFKREMGIHSPVDEEFVCDKLFDREPTDEELIFFMAQNEVHSFSGYVMVDKVKMIGYGE